MRRQRKVRDNRPRKFCDVCRSHGLVGEEVIPTGSGKWVHHGLCHSLLIEQTKTGSPIPIREPALFDP